MNRRLALIGGEEFSTGFEEIHLQLMKGLERRNRKVVYLPACAADDGEGAVDYWCSKARQKLSMLGAKVIAPHIVDRPSADDPENARLVAQADWIYLGGGYPHVGMRILSGTLVLQALLESVRRGVLLTGASAGAMLMGARSFVITPEFITETSLVWEKGAPPDWDPPLPPPLDCLGILPASFIAPHFNRMFIARWIERGLVPPDCTLIGIDEQTALIRSSPKAGGDGVIWQVAGNGAVTLCRSGQEAVRYTAGAFIPL